MRIYIDQIPETGLELIENCEPTVLDLDRDDIRFKEPINISAKITKGVRNIVVNLNIHGLMHLNCSRCLEEFVYDLTKEANLNFLIQDKKMIDLTDNLREEIIFAYPLKPLCHSGCKGLCVHCGRNLNKEKCNCK
jgi:uncharacterized protein